MIQAIAPALPLVLVIAVPLAFALRRELRSLPSPADYERRRRRWRQPLDRGKT